MRQRLSEIKNGCLYLPSDKQLRTFFDIVEHPNPWHFIYMLQDSFFPTSRDDPCPSKLRGANASSLGGTVVQACESESGLLGLNGTCIRARFIKEAPHYEVRVYQLEGLMGMDQAWEGLLAQAGRQEEVQEKHASPAALAERVNEDEALSVVRPWGWHHLKHHHPKHDHPKHDDDVRRSVEIPLEYHVCDPGDGTVSSSVTEAMLERQTAVLNRAYSGQDHCWGPSLYTISPVDMSIRFRQAGVHHVTDDACRSDCSHRITELTRKLVPREDGKIKVLLCSTRLLGLASFPGDHDSKRILIINPHTLPGGAMSNYNMGDTLSHEMGHYLGLFHTFQDGCQRPGDSVPDTPAEEEPFFGCPTARRWRKTCDTAESDPVHDFMDYTDDACMCTFTPDQAKRVWDSMKAHMPDIYALAS